MIATTPTIIPQIASPHPTRDASDIAESRKQDCARSASFQTENPATAAAPPFANRGWRAIESRAVWISHAAKSGRTSSPAGTIPFELSCRSMRRCSRETGGGGMNAAPRSQA